jgi:hypothetical protein
MGLDASVMCNCFRLGRTSEPPVPREWLHIDNDGYWSLKPEHDSDDLWYKVYEWEQTCCEHPEMEYASEHIANWAGYRLFQQALGRVGWERFPVLDHELPHSNGGQTEAPMAALALRELDEFRRVGDVGANVCLVDTATGSVIQRWIAGYHGRFILGGRSGLDAGFDESGFFIRDNQTEAEFFRATRFRQTILDPDSDPYGPKPSLVRFEDLETGRTFECRVAVSGKAIPWPDGRMQDDKGRYRFDRPAELHVEVRAERSTDYEYILGPLERVFRASVETGNPVRWG